MKPHTNAIQLELFLSDFVSESTRRERTVLLILCAVAVVVATTGLVPSRIDALGIEFGLRDQRNFLIATSAVLAYMTIAFVIHGLSDYAKWRVLYGELKRSAAKSEMADQHQRVLNAKPDIGAAFEALRERDQRQYQSELDRKRRYLRAYIDAPRQRFADQIVWLRVVFDLVLPVVLAFATGTLLLVVELPSAR